jgi:predicted membrane-bound spermidine synthase
MHHGVGASGCKNGFVINNLSANSVLSNLPLGGLVLLLIPFFLRIKQPIKPKCTTILNRLRELDWLGTLIFTSAVTCLFLALQWGGQTKPWSSPTVIGLFVGFVALMLLFALVQQRMGELSLIPPRLLKQRTVLFGSLYLALMYLSLSIVSAHPNFRLDTTLMYSSTFTTSPSISRRYTAPQQRIAASV